MVKTKKRKIIKIAALAAFIISLAFWIVYFVVASNKKLVKIMGGYVVSYEKISDSEYKASVNFNGVDKTITKEYTYDTEPSVGKSEVLYYLSSDKSVLYKTRPDLYQHFVWIAVVAAVFLLIAGALLVWLKSIKLLKNANAAKKIKVDANSILKK